MNAKLMLDYLSSLSANNNREWYHGHKKEYGQAFAEFEKLVQELIYGDRKSTRLNSSHP